MTTTRTVRIDLDQVKQAIEQKLKELEKQAEHLKLVKSNNTSYTHKVGSWVLSQVNIIRGKVNGLY